MQLLFSAGDEREDCGEPRIPTAAWLLGPLCHLPCAQETLPGVAKAAESPQGCERGAAHAGR